ncbi:N-6 DNA methylase [Bradyrhizobium sp. USDA 4506]
MYTKTLLCFVQLFIVSNRTDTWYFANNNARHFAFDADERFLPIYQFAAEDNTRINYLDDFADRFLAKCTLGQMISKYMVLIASEQKLLMMRAYQIYAVKAIIDCIDQNCGNGYIWHTTGSGKTLTSFKTSTLLKTNESIHKCLFVVDRIRRKLLDGGHIDTIIGLPANLFYSTGIPVCILVLKKCKKPDDILFINASEHFEKGKRQNYLSDGHIGKIIDTYQQRPERLERYARRVGMDEIEANDFNLNISRYVSTAEKAVAIDLSATHRELVEIEKQIRDSRAKHNAFLKELGLSPLPAPDK